jgi:cell division protein FtsI/penicillin-binding protein 2
MPRPALVRCGPTAGSWQWSAPELREKPFNRATQSRRQPGSAFKLFVYLARDAGRYTPDSLIDDRPVTIDGWSPGNNDGVYPGQISLREAFAGRAMPRPSGWPNGSGGKM